VRQAVAIQARLRYTTGICEVRDVVKTLSCRGALVLALCFCLALLDGSRPAGAVWDEIEHGDPNGNLVALTFDAGSVDGPASTILDILRANKLHVTFFLTGQWLQTYPDLARQVAADGHELANHTYYHPDLTLLSAEQITWELEYTNALIEANLGRTSKPWFRPPFGARDQRVLDLARDLGYRSIYWTLDSGDWRNTATGPAVLARVLKNVGPGDIVVHHVAAEATAEVLPQIIAGIQANGWRIVTVSELMGLPPATAH
jgi:peptidoglycan/xylan/chitin deacetylase (PgdA/CDA1 family)